MSEFWMGVIAFPIGALVGLIAWGLALRVLTWVGNAGAAGMHLGPGANDRQRALLGALTYAANHSWFITFGHLGFAVFAGQREAKRIEAYDRLLPKVSLRTLTKKDGAS